MAEEIATEETNNEELSLNEETEEELLSRHRKESKELATQITSLRKQVTKGEKKKKKEINQKCEDLKWQLKQKHEKELKELKAHLKNSSAIDNNLEAEKSEDDELTPEKLLAYLSLDDEEVEKPQEPINSQGPSRGKKKNRAKSRIQKRDKAIKEAQEKAALEAAEQPDYRKMEMENITSRCDLQNLAQYDIKPDGHCLFASIADQLKQRQDLDFTIQELRTKAAQYILREPDTFSPFLFDETTMTIKDIADYCKELETTPIWGGDLEILALAKNFNCPISVMMSGRANLVMNEEGSNPELKLVYYKHNYGLGEHYNSLRDKI